MVVSRYQEYVTQRMHQIIRRDAIIITHIAIVIVALLDIFRESEEAWPLPLKIVSLVALLIITGIGIFRLKNKSAINKKPLYSIVALTLVVGLATLFLADFGADYIYVALIPIFLANFYYSRSLVIAIYVFEAFIILLQPIVQNFLYADVIQVSGSPLLSWNSYALNLAAFTMMVFLSRLIVDLTEVSIEDKVAIQNAANETNVQKKRIEKILSLMNDALLGVDKSGVINFANDAACSLLGAKFNTLVGTNVSGCAHFETVQGSSADMAAFIYSVTDQGQSNFDIVYGDSKDRLTVEVMVRTVYDDTHGVTGYIVTFRDITEQATHSQERHAYISLLSHELRTPLATLEALLSSMHSQKVSQDPSSLERTSRIAHDQVLRLSRITNSLSDFVDAENPATKPLNEPVGLVPVIQAVIGDYAATAQRKNLRLVLDNKLNPDITAYTDKYRAEKVLRIVVDNAIKYTEKGSVTVVIEAGDAGAPCVKVVDTGIGISKHQQSELFTARKQGEDYETRARDGLGIGLYAAYRMAQMISASLTVASNLDSGSTFTVQFPANAFRAP